MIDNTDSDQHPWVHIKSQECPACDDGNEHFFVCFHRDDKLEQCTSCGTQFDVDGIPLDEPINKFK